MSHRVDGDSAPTPEVPLPDAATGADPHLWLEDVEGEQAMDFVRGWNERTESTLTSSPRFAELREEILEVLDSDDRIPTPTWRGGNVYNFWTDAAHERGIWRRTTLESYATEHPEWDVLLDVDALNAAEGASFVWKGARVLYPGHDRALVSLSPGGGDATEIREFDLTTRSFVEGGFHLPLSKGSAGWADTTGDTLLVARDFGEGSLTTSGYPRTVRRWQRGSDLADAPMVAQGEESDVLTTASYDPTPGHERTLIYRMPTFFTSEVSVLGEGDELEPVDVPESAEVDFHREWLTVLLREAWELPHLTHPAGTLLAIRLEDFRNGSRDFAALFEPTDTSSLVDVAWTRHHLALTILDDVRHRVVVLTPPEADAPAPATAQPSEPSTEQAPEAPAEAGEAREGVGRRAWRRRPVDMTSALTGPSQDGEEQPQDAHLSVSVAAVDSREDDRLWISTSGYLTPPTLWLADLDEKGNVREPRLLKKAPSYFDADDLQVTQHFVLSDDGTRVPYFQVGPRAGAAAGETGAAAGETGAAAGETGPRPTLLYGYGGFEVPLLPAYLGAAGRAWVRRGGVYVVANIRGGGEYGPTWHRAALRRNRHRAYEDFAAVAQDLVDRGVTTPAQLGTQGGSNGGLLMGNMLSTYPQKFGAVVVQVPLLDMKRYSHLLAGASWVAEYGDPDDPADWAFLQKYSAYHNIDGSTPTPPTLILTSTRDDRVHPGHARKLAALMESLGKDVLFWENIEGGHGGAASNAQRATMTALSWEFLWRTLA